MAIRPGTWTRRQVVTTLAATAATSLLARRASALRPAGADGFAFVGCMSRERSGAPPDGGRIHVFRVSGYRWTAVDTVASASPVHLALHPALPMVYAVHGLDLWETLPRGAVSAYRLDPETGQLQHIATQPLSLGATGPRGAAVAANGRSLFVAAERGGLYNLLPLGADGSLDPVIAIRKELGTGEGATATTAAPCQVVAQVDGSMLAVDAGQRTISSFRLDAEEKAAITLHRRTRVPLPAGSAASLLLHPEGLFLLHADPSFLSVLRLDRSTGELTTHRRVRHAGTRSLSMTMGGTQWNGWQPSTGEIVSRSFDPSSGCLGELQAHARGEGCRSLAMLAIA